MRIAAYQGVCADGDVAANIATTTKVYDQAMALGADFLLLPETFLSGYGSREPVERGALTLDDPRLVALLAHTAQNDMVLIVGLGERQGAAIYNTALIIQRGAILGAYRKTMLTGSDFRDMHFATDWDLPVWRAKGVVFGVIICADSSYVEVAQTLWWQGAQIIFSPHYNSMPSQAMDDHRLHVRNNHRGLAALLQVPVVRANVINWEHAPRLGYGDSAIFDARGEPLAEAGLFREALITADVDLAAKPPIGGRWRIPRAVREQLARAMLDAPVAEF